MKKPKDKTINLGAGSRGVDSLSGIATKETTELAWLIEKGSPATYLSVESGFYKWTEDVNKAIRFCRREDAEQIGEIMLDDVDRICEHLWHTGKFKT